MSTRPKYTPQTISRQATPRTHTMPRAVVHRSLTEGEKKIVAARLQWKCSSCHVFLPPAYQIDHTIPLCDGGDDTIHNCTAMCATCHANKTQRETIARTRARHTAAPAHEFREDTVHKNVATCTLCFKKRPADSDHVLCRAIDDPGSQKRVLSNVLSEFAFVPRITPPIVLASSAFEI